MFVSYSSLHGRALLMLTALPPSVKRLDRQWMPQAGMAVDSHYARAVTACDTGYVIVYSECILGVIIE